MGAVGLLSLLAQYWLMLQGGRFDSFVGATFAFFSYFTILTNILATAALLAPTLAPSTFAGRALSRPFVRAAIAVYIVIVALVYHTVLASQWNPQGLQFIVDKSLHYVMPVAFLADWLLFSEKGNLRLQDAPKALAFPIAFAIWTLGRGLVVETYPYPFLNVNALGYPAVFLNLLVLMGVFLGLMAFAIFVGRRIG